MARARTGTLALRKRGGELVWHAQVTVGLGDDKRREWFSLETTDKAVARRKLKRLVAELAGGQTRTGAIATAAAPDTVQGYAEAWYARRQAEGVASASDEWRNLELHALELVGELPITAVRSSHIRSILDQAVADGLSLETLRKIRGALDRLFKSAWQAELIDANPVARVPCPKLREVKRERTVPTDEEYSAYFAFPDGDVEVKMLSLLSRCVGGARTGDLNRLSWLQVDTVAFAAVVVARAKTGKPQEIEVPASLRPFLGAWWEQGGRPTTGPVFPCRAGRNVGGFKKPRGNAYADRFRRDLQRALDWAGLAVRRELFEDTDVSRRVDFHSHRRAFAGALAAAGVNLQRQMRLGGWTDSKTAMGYVMRSGPGMREIPVEALPALPAPRLEPRRCDEVAPVVLVGEPQSQQAVCDWGESREANSSAPSMIRTCDPRLRRAPNSGGSGLSHGPAADATPAKPLEAAPRRTESHQLQRLPSALARLAEALADHPELAASLVASRRAA